MRTRLVKLSIATLLFLASFPPNASARVEMCIEAEQFCYRNGGLSFAVYNCDPTLFCEYRCDYSWGAVFSHCQD